MGSIVLDWAEDDLEELEIRFGHRSAGNGDFMATGDDSNDIGGRLSQAKGPGRRPMSTEIRKLVRTVAAANPTLGCTANPWGTSQTRL